MNNECSFEVYDDCLSTMDLARDWILNNQEKSGKEPHFIQSLTQSCGRGKGSREWISERGNFFGTLIIPFSFSPKRCGEISFLTAVVLGKTFQTLVPSLDLKFKWPNDIMISGRKCGGILLEYVEATVGNFLCIGIGVNIVSYPKGTSTPSTCVMNHFKKILLLKDLRDIFIDSFLEAYQLWQKEGFQFIRTEWLHKALYINEPVHFFYGKKKFSGVFKTIDEYGGVVLITSPGNEKIFYTGDLFLNEQNL